MPTDGRGGRSPAGQRARLVARRVVRYLLLVAMAGVVLFPIYVTLVDALLPSQKIGSRPPTLFPLHPLWGSFATAFSEAHLGIYLRNSAIVTLATVAAQLITSVLAGYAFAFVRFPLRGLAFALCLATLMVPLEATIIPNYRTVQALGWYNSFPALIVPFVGSGIGVFLFRQAFRGVPPELRDAAKLDGYGHMSFLTRVVLPLNRPVVAAFGIYAFLTSWNQYLWPLIVTQTNSVRTVQIGLRQLSVTQFNRLDVVFAGTILAALPIFVLLFAFQKQLVRGLTAGAVKG
ncbi:MAG TPA: carbohydrate ABC transporter permease [Acidimicrobiales bacterium]|nr:carbohydrate ABC transporter permease [Acidimicrobiales bacterium]